MNIRKSASLEWSRREALAAGASLDQKASAEWYGRIFDPQLFQEREPPPRYYVRMGSAYIAFGGAPATDPTPKIDHFCALVKGYKPDEVRAAIEEAGISMGAGRLGMPTDGDGIRLQLLGVPGGLARTIIPSTRITTDDAAVAPVGLDHIVLAVSDVDRASTHYAKFFGPPATKKAGQVWFQIANTRLALEPVASGGKPAIERLSFRIAGFDRKAVAAKLQKLVNDDFRRITKVTAFRAYKDGVGHGGTYNQPNGGEFGKVAVALLEWQLKGDQDAGKMFQGANCGLCQDPKWHVEKKGIN